MRVLYISYFGLLNPLAQTQILPYLRSLASNGIEITVLSFEARETPGAAHRARLAAVHALLGPMRWKQLRYHKRPSGPATLWDVITGIAYSMALVLRYRINVVHVRSHVPALIGIVLKRVFRTKLIFDVRGLMAEEYVDAGTWTPGGILYSLTTRVERLAINNSDSVIVLTRWARQYLAGRRSKRAPPCRFEVIPCCCDLSRFAPFDGSSRELLGLAPDRFIVAYCGSLGGCYMTREMAACFAECLRLRSAAIFLVLTQSNPSGLISALTACAVPETAYRIRDVTPEQVPRYLMSADMGMSLIKACFSKRASSPTKLAEFLAAGLPVLSSAGIGDTDELLTTERVGVLVSDYNAKAYRAALITVMEMLRQGNGLRERCRDVARRYFSLETVGAEGYWRAYQEVASSALLSPAIRNTQP